MTMDLLTRIQRETHERLRELQVAVDEHDRLQAELTGLEAEPEPPAEGEAEVGPPPALQAVPEPPVDSGLPLAPGRSTNVVSLPVRPHVPPTRMVSPKVARLMAAPRRPALERAGVARVGAEEVDAETELYERAL